MSLKQVTLLRHGSKSFRYVAGCLWSKSFRCVTGCLGARHFIMSQKQVISLYPRVLRGKSFCYVTCCLKEVVSLCHWSKSGHFIMSSKQVTSLCHWSKSFHYVTEVNPLYHRVPQVTLLCHTQRSKVILLCCRVPHKNGPDNYAFVEVVRKRRERRQLKGFSCQECKQVHFTVYFSVW